MVTNSNWQNKILKKSSFLSTTFPLPQESTERKNLAIAVSLGTSSDTHGLPFLGTLISPLVFFLRRLLRWKVAGPCHDGILGLVPKPTVSSNKVLCIQCSLRDPLECFNPVPDHLQRALIHI